MVCLATHVYFHVLVQHTCTIYAYQIYIPNTHTIYIYIYIYWILYTQSIYTCHVNKSCTEAIYVYHIHIPHTRTSYTYTIYRYQHMAYTHTMYTCRIHMPSYTDAVYTYHTHMYNIYGRFLNIFASLPFGIVRPSLTLFYAHRV